MSRAGIRAKRVGKLRRVLAFALVGSAGACAGGGDDARPRVTVDTLPGGTVHVVNTPPDAEDGGAWQIVEELRIGTVDGGGPSSFGEIKGVAPLGDGRVAVLESQAQELRVFGADRMHQATWGGQGEGPGEMLEAHGLMLGPEGRLWVPDHRNARMSVFDPDEGFVDSYPMRFLLHAYVFTGVMLEDGRILKPSISMSEDRPYMYRVYDRRMELVDTIVQPARADRDRESPGSFRWTASDGRAGFVVGVPFYPSGEIVLDPRAAIWATTPGDPAYRIIRGTLTGDTTLIVETLRPEVDVSVAERDSARQRIRDMFERYGASPPNLSRIPEVKPPVSSMFLSEEGDLWVRTAVERGAPTEYDIHDANGRLLGSAVTPLEPWSALAPVVTGDHFWAVVRDELDVPYVVRARIERGTDR